MRVTAAFSRLLSLDGIWVRQVQFTEEAVVVTVALRGRLLRCPKCDFTTKARYDRRPVESTWRHLDLGSGASRCELRCGASPVRSMA